MVAVPAHPPHREIHAEQSDVNRDAYQHQVAKQRSQCLQKGGERRQFPRPQQTVEDVLEPAGNDALEGIWEELAYGDGFSAQEYKPSAGADLYRRSMYTFWKRTAPPPSMATFDAPDRERCTARRSVTNTPLQALVLMNDPTYVEAARALAQRILKEGGRDPAARVRHGFQLATARPPEAEELRVLRALAERQLRHYRRDKQAVDRLLRVGDSPPDTRFDAAELAAWTTVASAILNLDEVITKE